MSSSNPLPMVMIGVLLLGFTGAGVYFVSSQAPDPARLQPPVEVVRVPAELEHEGPAAPAPSPIPPAPATGWTKPSTADRMARDLKREQIWQALTQREGTPAEPDAKPNPEPNPEPNPDAPDPRQALELPPLDTAYIKDAIQEQLLPVAIECYESALEDEPELAGQLLVEFTIVGAEDIGGIVEQSAINEDSTLDNAFIRECMRESVMAVTFEPPEDGGRLSVTYPFNFEPE